MFVDFRVVFAMGVLGAVVFGAEPLVVKGNDPGYVDPEFAVVERCEVFSDSVVISRRFGHSKAIVTTEKREVKRTGDMQALITAAEKEKLDSKPNNLCDGPATFVQAGSAVLYFTGGCGSPRLERQGSAAYVLRAMADAYCPVTH